MTIVSKVNNDIENSVNAINNFEVQEMIKKLSEYGLAVAVPHMHGEDGSFLPLPDEIVSFEDNLKVSFVRKEDLNSESIVPVMWRWDKKLHSISVTAGCGLECRV